MNRRSGYFPSFDGWRALAVLAVLLAHDYKYAFGPLSTGWFQQHSMFGVEIFFGISGLLICSRLLQEEEVHGRVNLREFYIRRAFRILPPLMGYLIAIAALGAAHIIPVAPQEWMASLLFFRNYGFLSITAGQNGWYTAHFWSLAVEEHFYLMLPVLLVFVKRGRRLQALILLAAGVMIWRLYIQLARPYVNWPSHTDTHLDALLIPAIFAILLTQHRARSLLCRISKFWPLAALLVIGLVTTGQFPLLTPIAASVLIPLTLLGTVLHPGGLFSRMLELPPLRWIGRISYSLYLWQQLFFSGHYFPSLRPFGFLQDFPWRFVALLACAAASYYCLEKPLIRLGHKMAPPATPGRPAAENVDQTTQVALPIEILIGAARRVKLST
jgi:peptidoglycan/LPS O-acetylase OafA/YrhL